MASGTIKYTGTYYGFHSARAIGMGTSNSTVVVSFPWRSPSRTTPTVSNISASITEVGEVSASLDASRTNENAITFTLSKSGTTFTKNYSYFCLVRFTLA